MIDFYYKFLRQELQYIFLKIIALVYFYHTLQLAVSTYSLFFLGMFTLCVSILRSIAQWYSIEQKTYEIYSSIGLLNIDIYSAQI